MIIVSLLDSIRGKVANDKIKKTPHALVHTNPMSNHPLHPFSILPKGFPPLLFTISWGFWLGPYPVGGVKSYVITPNFFKGRIEHRVGDVKMFFFFGKKGLARKWRW